MKTPILDSAIASIIAILSVSCQPQAYAENPEEVGKVTWGRDYEAALKTAKSTGKPIFLLFQEVPGCAGCKQFGRDVLSNAEVVKTIQEDFVPLLIHNNKPGKDAEVLAKFKEPAWNFQVVRFVDAEGQDLIPPKERIWEAPELKQRMATVLKRKSANLQRVAFSQSCFWTGEMTLGAMDGVVRTEVGFLGGHEVTLVDFEPAKVSLETLTKNAKAAGVATGVYQDLGGYEKAPESDQKRQLQGTKYAKLKLTAEQATKINAFARTSPEKVETFLAK